MTKSEINGLLSLLQKKFHKKFKHQVTTLNLSIFIGILAVVIGLIAFALSWNLWDVWGVMKSVRWTSSLLNSIK